MEISVIIPVYNRAAVVQRTLLSVVEQSHRQLQLVLVDNDSSDNTADVLHRFAAEHHGHDGLNVTVTSEPRHSAGAARNRGFQLANAEWVVFFDSDDQMLPGLLTHYATLAGTRQYDIISAPAVLVWPDGNRQALPYTIGGDMLATQILHSQFATQRYAVRRTFFQACGGWNPTLPCWNDWELGVRLLMAGPRIGYLPATPPAVQVNHSGHDSITGNEFGSRRGQWEYAIELVETHLAQVPHNAPHYLRLLQWKRLALSAAYRREGLTDAAEALRTEARAALRASFAHEPLRRALTLPITDALYAAACRGLRGTSRIASRVL